MKTSVYNVVWADDEIDEILTDIMRTRLKRNNIAIVGEAHDGKELESILDSKADYVDAVIVDANFNESSAEISNERDTSGLNYARSLYTMKYKRAFPFFIFTNRSDELLKEIYADNPDFLKEFPRHKRWFNKSGEGEMEEMFEEIKEAVERQNSSAFIVRNKFQYELNAATLFDDTYEFVMEMLIRDHEGTLSEINEPFVSIRKAIEKVFAACEDKGLIPPISGDTNGTAAYFYYDSYKKSKDGKTLFEKIDKDIMAKPLTASLRYVVNITQDASHSKSNLKLDVDRYFKDTKDVLLLRSVFYIMLDVLKWFAVTALNNKDESANKEYLWREIVDEGDDCVDPTSEDSTGSCNE